MCYKTIADVDDGFGDRTPACREYTHPCADSDSRIYAAIPGRTFIGPVLQDLFFTVSWHSWNWNSNSIHDNTRWKSWVVICRGKNRFVDELHLRDPGHNPTSNELHLERSIAKESEPLLYRDGATPNRGNSCDAVRNSDESTVPFKRRYSWWRKEVECHSCLQVFQRRLSTSPHLKIGHEIGTSLWLRWTRNWRRCSLEFYESETTESTSEVRRAKNLGHGLASTHSWRKQQDEVPVLHEFQKFFIVYSCHSRTH